MRRIVLCLFAAALAGLVLVGCVQLPTPRPSNTNYYLLGSDLTGDTAAAKTTGLRLGLRKPRLPEYLDTPTIVTRRGPNEVHFAEFHRWGEDLGPALNRVLALNLEDQPGVQSAEVVPWPRGATFDYVVQLRVLRFEGEGPPPPGPDADDDDPIPTGHSQMTVGWTILGPEGDTVRTRGLTRHREEGWPVTDFGNLVAKLDTSLVVLAEDIRRRLETLPQETTR
jgi:uncharacterized lipoprotein YmbA